MHVHVCPCMCVSLHVEADPDYKPVCVESTATTRIPVKSTSQKKFDKAHQKNFSK